MAFDVSDPLAGLGLSFKGLQSGAMDIAYYVIWGIIILAVGFYIYKKYQDKKIYIYPVRINRQRNNGQVKEFNTVGGYIKKGNTTFFSVKMSRFNKKLLDKLPLSEFMDEDNRVYYWQVSPEAPLIQVKRDFAIEEVLVPNDKYVEPTQEEVDNAMALAFETVNKDEKYKDYSQDDKIKLARAYVEEEMKAMRNKLIDISHTIYKPVPTDLKQQVMLDIKNYQNTLGVDVNKQFAYFVIGVIALVIIGVVVFYIAVNKGDIPILTK